LAAKARSESTLQKQHPQCALLLQGHLFDSKFINTAFDVIEKRGAFEILDFLVVPNLENLARESQMVVALSAPDDATLAALQDDLAKLGDLLGVRVAEVRRTYFYNYSNQQYIERINPKCKSQHLALKLDTFSSTQMNKPIHFVGLFCFSTSTSPCPTRATRMKLVAVLTWIPSALAAL
jgi:hypothetical protein